MDTQDKYIHTRTCLHAAYHIFRRDTIEKESKVTDYRKKQSTMNKKKRIETRVECKEIRYESRIECRREKKQAKGSWSVRGGERESKKIRIRWAWETYAVEHTWCFAFMNYTICVIHLSQYSWPSCVYGWVLSLLLFFSFSLLLLHLFCFFSSFWHLVTLPRTNFAAAATAAATTG